MELTEILRALWAHKLATALVVVLAFGAAAAIKLKSRAVPTGAATVQILVDSPSSLLGDVDQSATPLISRASVFAQVMASQAVVPQIAEAAGIPASKITAQGPYSGSGETLDVPTPSEARSNQIAAERAPYRLTFVAQPEEPVITATVQAPTALAAATVANAVYPATQRYVAQLQRQDKTPRNERVTLRLLGAPQAAPVKSSRTTLMAAAFLGVLILGLLLILGIHSIRRRGRELEPLERELAAQIEPVVHDAGSPPLLASAAEHRR